MAARLLSITEQIACVEAIPARAIAAWLPECIQLRPVDPFLVEFYPKFQLSHRFKSLHMRSSFVIKYAYPMLIYPSEIIEMPKTSHICH